MPCCIKQFSVTIWWYLISFFSCQGVACFAFVFLANRNIVDSPNYGNSYPTRELFWNINIYIFWICDNYSNRWSSIMHTNNSIRALSCVKTFSGVPESGTPRHSLRTTLTDSLRTTFEEEKNTIKHFWLLRHVIRVMTSPFRETPFPILAMLNMNLNFLGGASVLLSVVKIVFK